MLYLARRVSVTDPPTRHREQTSRCAVGQVRCTVPRSHPILSSHRCCRDTRCQRGLGGSRLLVRRQRRRAFEPLIPYRQIRMADLRAPACKCSLADPSAVPSNARTTKSAALRRFTQIRVYGINVLYHARCARACPARPMGLPRSDDYLSFSIENQWLLRGCNF